MPFHILRNAALFGLVLFTAGCGSNPAAIEDSERAGVPAGSASSSPDLRNAGAIADLQASEEWRAPRCRWLETGAWVLAYAQETALYRAAYELGYIEMEEVGKDNRIGTPEPAWRIALTDAGQAEAANCPPASKPTTWGIPVSRREFISASHVGEDAGGRTIYEVEYEWVPTAVGERVRHVLTDKMAVEEGTYRTKVYLRNSPYLIAPGENGWVVDAIDDFDAVRLD